MEQEKWRASHLTVTSCLWPKTLDFPDCALGEGSEQCRQEPLSWHHGHKKPPRYDITCSGAVWHHPQELSAWGFKPSWSLDKFSPQSEITDQVNTQLLQSWFGFQHEKQHEKNADVSGLWFLLFPFPASSLKKRFKLFPCTRKAQGAEMFLTRQLSEVLKVWGTKLSGPADQLTERQTGGELNSFNLSLTEMVESTECLTEHISAASPPW